MKTSLLKQALLFFALIACSFLVSQNDYDVLKRKLELAVSDTAVLRISASLSDICPENEIEKFATQAIDASLRLEKTRGKLADDQLLYKSTALNNLGFTLRDQGNIREALNYYYEALSLEEQIAEYPLMSQTLNNIAHIIAEQGKIKEAYELTTRSLECRKKSNDTVGIAATYNAMGFLLLEMGDTTDALANYNKALNIARSVNALRQMAIVYDNISSLNEESGRLNVALLYSDSSYTINKMTGDLRGLNSSLMKKAFIYEKTGDLKRAIHYADSAFRIANQLAYPLLIYNNAGFLKMAYTKSGDYKKALEMADIYSVMKDSVINLETREASVKKQLAYDHEKEKLEIRKENEKSLALADEKLRHNKIVLTVSMFALLVVLIFAIYVFRIYRQKQKANVLLQKQKQTIQSQKEEVEAHQKEILDSIYYARRIQRALITSERYIERALSKLKR